MCKYEIYMYCNYFICDMSHNLPVHLHYSQLVEGLFHYNAHFIITLFSLGSHHERYNEVAVFVRDWSALL